MRTSDLNVKILENVYRMLSESKMMYSVEMWDLVRDGKTLTKLMGDFVRKYVDCPNLQQVLWLN
jgi:hypothetical protein